MINKWVRWWLIVGLVMLFFQVIIGGITRLTESGLSITKWELVSGTVPPLTNEAWLREFDLYKATPQYKEINQGMELSDFKFIYFWEYIHRFWARVMGFVFLIPFLFFYFKGLITKALAKDLGIVVLLAALAASFGWIMVASGLIDRPWVNAYKLSLHLCIAFCVYASLFWCYLKYVHKISFNSSLDNVSLDNVSTLVFKKDKISFIFLLLLWVQLFLGGVMSGMKAGVYYPTWPLMSGEFIPQFIFNINEWSVEKFNKYDAYNLLPALIQVLHRFTAYVLFFLGIYVFSKVKTEGSETHLSVPRFVFLGMLIIQVLLGIITVIMCKGEVPILWGVLHQGGALCLLSVTLWLRFKIKLRVI